MAVKVQTTCDIVIAIWNNVTLTKNCIESIYCSVHIPYRLILIDNASDSETQDYLEGIRNDKRCEVLLIRNKENLGNTLAIIQGMKASSAEFVCTLDNDTILADGALEEMIAIARNDSTVGIVVPSSNSGYKPKDVSYTGVQECGKFCEQYKGATVEMSVADCFCSLIPRKLINTIGYWNEIFSPGYFEDAEYCMRAIHAGFKVVCAKGAYVYHIESGTFMKDKNKEAIYKRNAQIFYNMYGKRQRILFIVDSCNVDYYRFVRIQAYENARKSHFVWIIEAYSENLLNIAEHANMKRFSYKPRFFGLKVLFRVLLRKKKFDSIYVTTPGLYRVLRFFTFIHQANVIYFEQ